MTARIDAHHHLWDLAVRDQPGLAAAEMEPIRRCFGVDELTAEAAASDIAGTIVVQTVADVSETEELLDLADTSALIIGVVGYVDLTAPDVGERLDRLLARASGSWLVGIRSLVQYEPDPAWLLQPQVLAGLREVAQRGLVYDLLIRPHQMEAAVGAVSAVTEARFVLDHLAKPAIACAGWEPWAAQLAELAVHDNVWAKLSGLVTEANWSSWSAADLRPYADHALDSFGADRLLFGSDWPVCTLASTYADVVATAEDLVVDLSPSERDAVFGSTSAAVYGLEHHGRQ